MSPEIPQITIMVNSARRNGSMRLTIEELDELIQLIRMGETATYVAGPNDLYHVDGEDISSHNSPHNIARRLLFHLTGKTLEELQELGQAGLEFYDEIVYEDEEAHICNEGCKVAVNMEATNNNLVDLQSGPWDEVQAALNVPSIEVPE